MLSGNAGVLCYGIGNSPSSIAMHGFLGCHLCIPLSDKRITPRPPPPGAVRVAIGAQEYSVSLTLDSIIAISPPVIFRVGYNMVNRQRLISQAFRAPAGASIAIIRPYLSTSFLRKCLHIIWPLYAYSTLRLLLLW